MEFSRQEYWSVKPFPSPEEPLDTGVEPGSPALQVNSLPSESPGKPEEYIKDGWMHDVLLMTRNPSKRAVWQER